MKVGGVRDLCELNERDNQTGVGSTSKALVEDVHCWLTVEWGLEATGLVGH